MLVVFKVNSSFIEKEIKGFLGYIENISVFKFGGCIGWRKGKVLGGYV